MTSYLIPHYHSPEGTHNTANSSNWDAKIYTHQTFSGTPRIVFYPGKYGEYLFGVDIDTTRVPKYKLFREHYETDTIDYVDLPVDITNYRELYNFIPLTASTGILVVNVYAAVAPAGVIRIYTVDFIAGICTDTNHYDYNSTTYPYDQFVGALEYAGDVRVVMDFYQDLGGGRTGCSFLVYKVTSDTFIFADGPAGINDDYYYEEGYLNGDGYIDVGDGNMAIRLDMAGSADNETNLQHQHILLLDTGTGTYVAATLPRNMHNPLQAGDYYYDVYTYFSMAPHYALHKAIVQTWYSVYDGTNWENHTRILSIDSAGFIVVEETFDEPMESGYAYKLMYNDDTVISCYNYQIFGVFHNVITHTELFRLLMYYSYDYFPCLSPILAYDNSIIWLYEAYAGTWIIDYADSRQFESMWQQNDHLAGGYSDGWAYAGFDVTAPTLEWGRFTDYQGHIHDGVKMVARGSAFSYPGTIGDFVVGVVCDAATLASQPLTGLVAGERYVAIATNEYVSNNTPTPHIYASRFRLYLNNGTGFPAWLRDFAFYGWGSEDHGADPVTDRDSDWAYVPYVDIDGGTTLPEGNNPARAWFFSWAGGSDLAACGDISGWQGDNEGAQNVEIYESPLDHVELSTKCTVYGNARTGETISATIWCTNYDGITAGAAPIELFVRIRYTDNSTSEATYLAVGETQTTINLVIPVGDNGKTFSTLEIGGYLGKGPGKFYDVAIVISHAHVPAANIAADFSTIDRVPVPGYTAVQLLDLKNDYPAYSMNPGYPPYVLRLLEHAIIFPTRYNSKYVVCYPIAGGLMQAIVWN